MAIKLHKKYKPLFRAISNKALRYFIITGSRGSAKSYAVSTFISNLVSSDRHIILFTRWTMKSAHISIIPEFKEKIEQLGLTKYFTINKDEIIHNPTGNTILFRGINTSAGNQTANLKSIMGVTTLVIDEAEELVDEDTFDTIDLSIRCTDSINRVIIVMNPCNKNHFIYRRFFKETGVKYDFNGIYEDTLYIFTTYLDNIKNLSKSFLKLAERMKRIHPTKYLNKFMGQWTDDAEGSLWKQSLMIDPYRIRPDQAPQFRRVVVANDPNVAEEGDQDECGIIVVGEDYQSPPHYYVIKDYSGQHKPSEWGKITVGAYKNHMADKIVAEKNQGGALVKSNIKNVDQSVNVGLVHSKKGKMLRAEPVAGLYEEGRVHHIGYFPELELEMTTYVGEPPSPNRLDSLVFGIDELSQNNNKVGITQL